MGFDLNSMTGAYKDFARTYLFYAKVDYSTINAISDHSYLVTTASLPAHTLQTATTNWQGMEYKIPTTHSFAEYSITFRSDPNQDLRKGFVEWMKDCQSPTTNVHGAVGDIFGSVQLTQIDGTGAPVMSYHFHQAFPSSVGEVALDYGTKDIATFSVTFTYSYFAADAIFGGSPTAAPTQA